MSDLDKIRSANELTDYLSRIEPPKPGPYRRPRDSATLILLDGAPSEPKVLLGKRSDRHAFLPGKFVFPGGAIDPSDSRMSVTGMLDPDSQRRLLHRLARPSPTRARALALAAIRETCEETGLLIGQRNGSPDVTTFIRMEALCRNPDSSPTLRRSPTSPAQSPRLAGRVASMHAFSSRTGGTSPPNCRASSDPNPNLSNCIG